MASTLAAPKQISPFIRFCRYAAVISGFTYGAVRMRSLRKKEAVIQAQQEKVKVIRAARLQREKDLATKAEMATLAKEFGITAK